MMDRRRLARERPTSESVCITVFWRCALSGEALAKARPEISAIPAGKRPSGDLAYNVAKIEGPFGRPRGVDIAAPLLLDLGDDARRRSRSSRELM